VAEALASLRERHRLIRGLVYRIFEEVTPRPLYLVGRRLGLDRPRAGAGRG
jgi:hypothetical protein